MKKKVVIGIVAVAVLTAIVAGIVFIPQCFAPDFPVDGTYIAEDGAKVVVSENKISSEDVEDLNGELKLTKFDTQYARDMGSEKEMIRFYDVNEFSLFIYIEDGKTMFGYGDRMFTLEK